MAEVETVRLVRNPAEFPDSHTATVNREDVETFKALGWVEEGEEPPAQIDLDDLTVAALRELAEERRVDLGDATKKADIIAAIQLAAEEEQPPA